MRSENLFILFSNIINVDCLNELGDTPLITATQQNQYTVAQYLLSKGAALNHKNKHTGETALTSTLALLSDDRVKNLSGYLNVMQNIDNVISVFQQVI